MSETFHVVLEEQHNALVAAAYKKRGYSGAEAAAGARFCAEATRHGIRTHNALKALHLDHLFGSGAGGCVPKSKIEKIKLPYTSAQVSLPHVDNHFNCMTWCPMMIKTRD